MAKVFLVEDDPDLLELERRYIELGGHEIVLVASSLSDALDKTSQLRRMGVEIAIVDGNVGSGPEDGPKIYKTIKEVISIPVVSFSGDIVNWADENPRKPMDIFKLGKIVTQILNKKEK
ncbi:MAG: hypothetical protein ABID67_01175 [Candidatus Nealsonbacteria bacterium]